jgi:O-acetyl-ADP-ribose deacetylase (regulator of RNase III)
MVKRFKEAVGDMWEMPADAYCVTTNTEFVVRADQDRHMHPFGIMGGGVAYEAARRFPGIERNLGKVLVFGGSEPIVTTIWENPRVVCFPTKTKVHLNSNPHLIGSSCRRLMYWATYNNAKNILLPRPGCGLGGLRWEDVEPICAEFLDERVTVVSK